MSCNDDRRLWCVSNGAGFPGLTFGEFGATVALTPLTRTLFVSKGEFTGEVNGSISQPYSTIQEAINATIGGKQRLSVILVAPDFYDEDLVVPAFNSYLAIIGLGPFVLGNNLGTFPCVSTVPRGITLVVDDDKDGSTSQIRSGLTIGNVSLVGEASSTFTALASSVLISGGITTNLISSDGRLHELHLPNVKICEDVNLDANGATEFDIYAYNAYFDKALTATLSNMEVIVSTQFDGLVQIRTWGRCTQCEFRSGMTAGTTSNPQNNGSLPPSGMFQCDLSGVFTSLNGAGADPFPLDGSSNYFFKTNGASLSNATKLILEDTVP